MAEPIRIDLMNSKETKLDLSSEPFVTQPPLAALPRAGFVLAKIILTIMSGYLIFLILYIGFGKPDSLEKIDITSRSFASDSSTFAHQQALLQIFQTEKKNSRDFIVQISQMILLNLLLPTLTAILGYIFGSREEARKPTT